jgi:hypothetical protein
MSRRHKKAPKLVVKSIASEVTIKSMRTGEIVGTLPALTTYELNKVIASRKRRY